MPEEPRAHVSKSYVGLIAVLTAVATFGLMELRNYASGVKDDTTEKLMNESRIERIEDRNNDQSDSLKIVYRKLKIQ